MTALAFHQLEAGTLGCINLTVDLTSKLFGDLKPVKNMSFGATSLESLHKNEYIMCPYLPTDNQELRGFAQNIWSSKSMSLKADSSAWRNET